MATWIDIEKEVHIMLYGDKDNRPQGHWVVFRWYDPSQLSKYWDNKAREAIGGPKFKYRQFALRTTYRIGSSFTSPVAGALKFQNFNTPGTVERDERLYIIERCYNPKMDDVIFEYNCDYPDDVNEFIEFAKKNVPVKFRIKNVEPVRTDGSKIVYYLASTKLDQKRE